MSDKNKSMKIGLIVVVTLICLCIGYTRQRSQYRSQKSMSYTNNGMIRNERCQKDPTTWTAAMLAPSVQRKPFPFLLIVANDGAKHIDEIFIVLQSSGIIGPTEKLVVVNWEETVFAEFKNRVLDQSSCNSAKVSVVFVSKNGLTSPFSGDAPIVSMLDSGVIADSNSVVKSFLYRSGVSIGHDN